MSFIDFESAAEKEKIRQELRSVREKLLEKAEFNAKRRDEIAAHRKINQWMLPEVAEKLEKTESKSKKKHKKEKKSKKEKKKKSKKKRKSSDDDSSDSVEIIPKRSHRKRSSSSSGSSTEDEWVEKSSAQGAQGKPAVRDDWMSSGFLLPTYKKEETPDKKDKNAYEAYNPAQSARELNPHWKDGGSGLPSTFQKPSEDFSSQSKNFSQFSATKRQNWRKKIPETKTSRDRVDKRKSPSDSESSSDTENPESSSGKPPEKPQVTDFLTDAQMNELGAKMIKAEIMGNTKQAAELKEKLGKAKLSRENFKDKVKAQRNAPKVENRKIEEVLLTATDSRGVSRPVSFRDDSDLWGGRRGGKKKRPKVETHESGERTRFFPDDDRRSLREMFESEKLISASDSDAQYAKIAGRKRRQGDDLEDIFAEEVRRDIGEDEKSARERDRAIREHEKMSRTLDNCEMCFDSAKMAKELIVSMGSKVYLSLPWHEALQTGHCIISPIQHVSCSTQLDEEVWREVQDFQNALIRMFSAQGKDCVFYEIANKLHRRPHVAIHCIPSSEFELAPFYFKKAIQESESEWAQNRQLVDLKKEDKSLRRAIPRGLPYFWVSFTDHAGFAHVIEDQERFPANFAMEILGGLLNLDPRRWRKPRKELNIIQKVKQFADSWRKYDITR